MVMATTKGSTGRSSGMSVDSDLVRELAELLGETGLTEIEVEDGPRRIRVARGGGGMAQLTPAQISAIGHAEAAQTAAHASAARTPGSPTTEAPAESAPAADDANAVKSPMVGTAYLAPDPGSPNFVSVGDTVKKGDTLLIVEAMKVMNPITAPADGTVKEILIDNGEPVEFDQPLAIVS